VLSWQVALIAYWICFPVADENFLRFTMSRFRFKDDLSGAERLLYKKIHLISAALGLGALALIFVDLVWLRRIGIAGGIFCFLVSTVFSNARHFSVRVIWSRWARCDNG